MRRINLILSVGLVLTVSTACGSGEDSADSPSPGSSSSSAANDDPIIIGAAVAQSGPFQLYDEGQTTGMQYAIDEINAPGGVCGRQFELIVADHKSDQAQIQSAAQQVLDDGADFIVTTVDYDFGAPAALAAQKAGLVSISGAGAPEFGKSGPRPAALQRLPGHAHRVRGDGEFAKSQASRSPYLLEDTSIEYSKSLCDEFETTWTRAAATIAGRDTFAQQRPLDRQPGQRALRPPTPTSSSCAPTRPAVPAPSSSSAPGGVDLPIIGGAAFDGTFWTEAIPDLSNFYNPRWSRRPVTTPTPSQRAARAASSPGGADLRLFGYENIETIVTASRARRRPTAQSSPRPSSPSATRPAGRSDHATPTDCHAPIGRAMAMIEKVNGKDKFLEYVTPTSVSEKAC